MYILLNREALTINYKHLVPVVLCNLAWIELQTQAYSIVPCSTSAFRGLTEMELKVLYRNTTGKEMPLNGLNACLEVLTSMIIEMPVSDVDESEAEMQAGCIVEGQKGFYKYVRGAARPVLVADLFNKTYNANSNPEVERLAAQGIWPLLSNAARAAAKAQQTAPAAPTAAPIAKPVQRASTPPKEPGAATTSGKIWAMADQVKQELESKSRFDVTHLKKLVLDTMLAAGINKSTITTQLSHWQKNRLAV